MLNKINFSTFPKSLIIYVVLIVITLAVYGQVIHYDSIIEDKPYLVESGHVQSGITLEGIRWAFSSTHAEFWHPITWLSLMLDNELHGINDGGYHMTNVMLHILSTLLLFAMFNRMTGAVWKSAFVAAAFALHPLNVESVAWISERKDVLSVFFGMVTLYLYILYSEKPHVGRYLLVLFSFMLALMSKPMLVTLPVVMILLDYWPLSRFRIGMDSRKSGLWLRQLREKAPFFILSIIVSVVTLYAQQYNPSETHTALVTRLAGASFAFVTYLGKLFWPYDLAFCHPSAMPIAARQAWGAAFLMGLISAAVIVMMKRLPFLFVGWLWYAITILPVIGIIPSKFVPFMFDHFVYWPSIGIAIMTAWGVPLLFPGKDTREKFLFPVALAALMILAMMAWKQCSYWKDSLSLFNHTLRITKHNALAYHHLGYIYDELGRYQLAINHYSEAIRLKPHHARYYNNRGIAFAKLGQYQKALEDYDQAIRLQPDLAEAYVNRGSTYILQGDKKRGCLDAQKACELGNCQFVEMFKNNGDCR